jgi:hypothetical protein
VGRRRGRLRAQSGQAAVEYAGVILVVAALVGAMLPLLHQTLTNDMKAFVQSSLCVFEPSGGDGCPSVAAGSSTAAKSPAQTGVGTVAKVLARPKLIDACAGAPSATSVGAFQAVDSKACRDAVGSLDDHQRATLAVLAAALQASQRGNDGTFAVLLKSYLANPAWAVIALSPAAQQRQEAGNALLDKIDSNHGDIWDRLGGSLCGGYGLCLFGTPVTQGYQQAYHASAQISKITTPVLLASGIAGATRELAGLGLRTMLTRAGIGGKDLDNAEQAIKGLDGEAPETTTPAPIAGGATGLTTGEEVGIVRNALQGAGNFGLGSATEAEADRLGRDFVGPGFTRSASNRNILISADRLRIYRPPTYKPNLGLYQANFERRFEPGRAINGNGHLDILDLP